MIKKILSLAVVGVFVCTTAAFAQMNYGQKTEGMSQKREAMHRQKGAMFDKIAQELNLTDEQKATLEANRKKHFEEMKAMRTELKEKRDALRQALQSADTDEATIRALSDKVKALQNKKMDMRTEGILETKAVLSPEQFQKLQQLQQQHRKRRMSKMGKRSFGGSRRDQKWGGPEGPSTSEPPEWNGPPQEK